MRRCFYHLAFVVLVLPLAAREIPVKNAAELKAAAAMAVSGDTIRLASGRYDDVKLRIAKNGTQGRPIQVVAVVPGEAILGGNSEIDISGAYVVMDGLYFLNGSIASGGADRSVITFNSHHGVLRNTAIVDYNPADFDASYYWVFFKGSHNTVERCYFKGKNNLNPLIGNGLEDAQYNSVVGSYFKNIPFGVGNGREIIRVWGSGKFDEKTAGGAYFVVRGNLFHHADGEGTEIISLKSNFNQVVDNTVRASRGCVNIRRGANNTIKGNIVLGEGVAGAQGLRMSGANHVVQANYVSGCEYGIRVSAGSSQVMRSLLTIRPKRKATPRRRRTPTASSRLIRSLRSSRFPITRSLLLTVLTSNSVRTTRSIGQKTRWSCCRPIAISAVTASCVRRAGCRSRSFRPSRNSLP